MTGKRYYQKDYDEKYYVFDSKTLPESEFEERVEYGGYEVFADSLTSKNVVDLLNENDELKQQLSQLAKVNREGVQKVQSLAKENEQLKKEINKYIAVNNGLNTEYEWLKEENEQLKSENDSYKNMFFEIVETALTDKNCRELYCEGLLDIFDKANSLNQAREMIKEHLK